VTVAEELHFGRAAARLNMAQPPLSQQIRRLERDLGLELFERTTRTVELTDAGRTLIATANRVLASATQLEQQALTLRRGDGGTLRLSFVDSASYEVMPRFLRSFRNLWPEVHFELTSLSSDEQHRALEGGHIDLGIARTAGRTDDIRSHRFHEEALVVAAPSDHPLTVQPSTNLAALVGQQFIGFDRRVSPTLHAEVTTLFAQRNIGYDPVIEATEYTTILGLVAAGQGVAVVPAGVKTFHPPDLSYLKLKDEDATTALVLLSRAEDRSPLVARAHDVMGDLFGADRAGS